MKYESYLRGFHGFLLNSFIAIIIIVGIFFILFGIISRDILSIVIGTSMIFTIIVFKKKIKKISERKLEEDIKESKNKKWYEKAEFEFGFGDFGFSFVPVIFINFLRSFFSKRKLQKKLKQNYQTIHSPVKEFSYYTNIKYSIILQFPKIWRKNDLNVESDNLIALVKFENPKNKNVLIIIFTHKKKFQIFNEFLSLKINELKKQNIIFITSPEFSDEINIYGNYQIIYKEQESEIIQEKYHYLVRYIYVKDRIYEIFCQSDISSFDSNLPLFEKIMDTFQIS